MELARDSVRVLWGLRSVGRFLECSHPSAPTAVGHLGRILSLSLFFAGIEDSGSGHAFPAARVVGGCVAPVLLAAYGVLSSLSFN